MSSLTLWSSPLADFDTVVRRTFGPSAFGSVRRTFGFTPAAEVTRDGSDAVLRLELPGVDVSKDVVVEVVNGQLVVRGERRDERASSEHGRTLRGVRYGSFRRAFARPIRAPSKCGRGACTGYAPITVSRARRSSTRCCSR